MTSTQQAAGLLAAALAGDTPADADIAPNGPDTIKVTVTFKMTAEQRDAYGAVWGISDSEVRAGVRQKIANAARSALSESYLVSEFMSFTVSDPR